MALVQAGTAGVRSLGRAPPHHGHRLLEPPHHVPAWATGPGRVLPAAALRVRAVPRWAAAVAASRAVRGPRIMRLVVRPPLLLTQRAPAPRASFAGAQRVGPSRLGRGAAGQGPAAAACARILMRAGPRPPVLAVRRAGPLAGGCVRTNRMYDRRGLLTV